MALIGLSSTENRPLNEAETRAVFRGKAVRARTGRTDYTLRLVGEKGTQPVAVAILEAKSVERATDGLELLDLFEVPSVREAGGLKALEGHDDPKQLLMETKRRLFVAEVGATGSGGWDNC